MPFEVYSGMTMNKILATAIVTSLLMSGCAAYRTDSNISSDALPVQAAKPYTGEVKIIEGMPTNLQYKEISRIEVSVKKLTIFHKDPTKEQADAALVEKARAIGADAVIGVKYDIGIGLMTWGYMDAEGLGVKLQQD
jgi:uncharacterized protein YbjQ (UPF0145 family)